MQYGPEVARVDADEQVRRHGAVVPRAAPLQPANRRVHTRAVHQKTTNTISPLGTDVSLSAASQPTWRRLRITTCNEDAAKCSPRFTYLLTYHMSYVMPRINMREGNMSRSGKKYLKISLDISSLVDIASRVLQRKAQLLLRQLALRHDQ